MVLFKRQESKGDEVDKWNFSWATEQSGYLKPNQMVETFGDVLEHKLHGHFPAHQF